MSHYKPYPMYKDSGVEWLGQVPEHWEIKRINEQYYIRNGFPFDSDQFSPEGEPHNRLVRIRDLSPVDVMIFTQESCHETSIINDGDVLVGMDGDFNTVLWNGGKSKLNQRVCALRGRTDLLTKYLLHNLPIPLKIINDTAYSTTVKHLSSIEITKIKLGFPPLII